MSHCAQLRQPTSPLFPYTTLFRSMNHEASGETPDGPTGKMPVLPAALLRAKKLGFSDRQLAIANGVSEKTVRSQRIKRSEEHTSESSHLGISYAVFCLKKKKTLPT